MHKTLRQHILKKEGKHLPSDVLVFLKESGAIKQDEYKAIQKQRKQSIQTTLMGKSGFVSAFISKCKNDLQQFSKNHSLVPSSEYMNRLFMFGLVTDRFDNPTLNFWGDFRKDESVDKSHPIRYRGYFKHTDYSVRMTYTYHTFEWRKSSKQHIILVYTETNSVDQYVSNYLTKFFFKLYHSPSSKQNKQSQLRMKALELELTEAFVVLPPKTV